MFVLSLRQASVPTRAAWESCRLHGHVCPDVSHTRQTLHSLSGRKKNTLILFSYKIFNKYNFQKYIARSTHNSQVHKKVKRKKGGEKKKGQKCCHDLKELTNEIKKCLSLRASLKKSNVHRNKSRLSQRKAVCLIWFYSVPIAPPPLTIQVLVV